MANPSQCLEEGGGRWPPRPPGPYSEAQRLALEELVSGGPEALRAFLRRERLPPFLSEPEVQAIARGALPPAAGPEPAGEASLDASSLTYFPERSDLEPPALELGWPGFASGAFRGLTRVEAHFQPGCGDSIYGCKEAVRRQIRSARQVIALVMDSFTDIDIFGDLQDAYNNRRVPVYILLDQDFLPHFLEMCKNLGVCPEEESLMRVRTLTGNTYYMRSGAKIVGKVHEKFMLIDGIRVITGSYSFTWSDGKLNSSNLLLLSGQVVEHFDLQFRILYAQSMPINPKWPSSCRNSGIFDHLPNRTESPRKYTVEENLRAEFARLSSTPKRLLKDQAEGTPGGKLCDLGRSFLCEEEWFSDQEAIVERRNASTQTGPWEEVPVVTKCNAATQTGAGTAETGTQTSVPARMMGTQTSVLLKTAVTQTKEGECTETPLLQRKLSKEEPFLLGKVVSSSSLRSLSSSSSQCSLTSSTGSVSSLRSFEYPSSHRAEYFHKLHKERQFHYSTIRSKLSHMVDILSRRGRVPENYMTRYPGRSNLKQRRDISTSLRSLRDVSLFSLNR
ncbi:PREDICTED: protein FAM83D-B-like [Calidris pugnax]|uniref:protein FAM83D-B-like n=1 Tax=Calidris pugnax TaxID=198806 RepID=UPI00071D68DD|nr:PREDICTED: protein FAM83D-B-like [Calidris pugnax]